MTRKEVENIIETINEDICRAMKDEKEAKNLNSEEDLEMKMYFRGMQHGLSLTCSYFHGILSVLKGDEDCDK